MKRVVLMLCLMFTSIFANGAKSIISSSCYTCHGNNMERSAYGVSKIPNTLNQSMILKKWIKML